MVLAPWSRPIPFTRGWCLYEIYCAIETNSKFEVCLPNRQIEQLLVAITTKSIIFGYLLDNIDVAMSECFNPVDLEHILHSVRQMEGGIERANYIVKKTLRSWLNSKINEFARFSSQNTLQKVQRLYAYGMFLKSSELEGATELFEETLAIDINEYINDVRDSGTLSPRSVRAACFYELGVAAFEHSKSLIPTKECHSRDIDCAKAIKYFQHAISEVTIQGGASLPYSLRTYYQKLVEVHKFDGNISELSRYENLLQNL
jgi:hypothetical protein